MDESRKPLHPYEQSMLLVAMLFDGKNINDILSVLPDQQRARMHYANEIFLKMPRNERMTEIVFELRRLLLVDEHRIDWIHQSWIDDALAKEPPYLRPVIDKALAHGSLKKGDGGHRSFVPLPVIFNMFIEQFINTRQKTAIYEPVLMKLQSLKDEAQDEVFARVGIRLLACFKECYPRERVVRFFKQRGMTASVDDIAIAITPEKNPLSHAPLCRYVAREIARFRPSAELNLPQFTGLLTVAMYLSPFKHHWQRTITLGLHRRLGLIVESLLPRMGLVLDKHVHQELADFVIASLV